MNYIYNNRYICYSKQEHTFGDKDDLKGKSYIIRFAQNLERIIKNGGRRSMKKGISYMNFQKKNLARKNNLVQNIILFLM